MLDFIKILVDYIDTVERLKLCFEEQQHKKRFLETIYIYIYILRVSRASAGSPVLR